MYDVLTPGNRCLPWSTLGQALMARRASGARWGPSCRNLRLRLACVPSSPAASDRGGHAIGMTALGCNDISHTCSVQHVGGVTSSPTGSYPPSVPTLLTRGIGRGVPILRVPIQPRKLLLLIALLALVRARAVIQVRHPAASWPLRDHSRHACETSAEQVVGRVHRVQGCGGADACNRCRATQICERGHGRSGELAGGMTPSTYAGAAHLPAPESVQASIIPRHPRHNSSTACGRPS